MVVVVVVGGSVVVVDVVLLVDVEVVVHGAEDVISPAPPDTVNTSVPLE